MRNVILLEVNEVPLSIWDRYASAHPNSSTARLMEGSHQLQTVSEDVGYETRRSNSGVAIQKQQLAPWTTWPTVHRGVTNIEHGIWDIGQDLTEPNRAHPPVWDILAANGVSVGVFGSLHSYPIPSEYNYSFYVPDPFAAGSETIPTDVEAFQAFSLGATRRSSRNVGGVDPRQAASFVAKSPLLGLRPSTGVALARQLIEERRNPAVATRRRAFQSLVGFDVFDKLLNSHRPAFSTFFVNHVAAAMHRYWAAAYPEDYENPQGDQKWRVTYRDEIDFAMGVVDQIIERLLKFCDDNPTYSLAIASSMGQAATKARTVKTELALSDHPLFMQKMGVPDGAWRHTTAMFPNFNFFVDAQYQHTFRDSISKLRVSGEPLDYREADNGFFSLDFGQPNLIDLTIEFDGERTEPEAMGLSNMAIDDLAMKCADHIAEGALFMYVPGEVELVQDRRSFPTTRIAPAILRHLGCEVPDYMTHEDIPGLMPVPAAVG